MTLTAGVSTWPWISLDLRRSQDRDAVRLGPSSPTPPRIVVMKTDPPFLKWSRNDAEVDTADEPFALIVNEEEERIRGRTPCAQRLS